MKFKKNYMIVASRGRMENHKWTQKLEVRSDGLTNTITSVVKDNLVLEIHRKAVDNG